MSKYWARAAHTEPTWFFIKISSSQAYPKIHRVENYESPTQPKIVIIMQNFLAGLAHWVLDHIGRVRPTQNSIRPKISRPNLPKNWDWEGGTLSGRAVLGFFKQLLVIPQTSKSKGKKRTNQYMQAKKCKDINLAYQFLS